MISKKLNKSAAERLERFLKEKDSLVDKFEDLIEDTVFEKPYYYCYRKFKWGWWNPRTAFYKVKYGVGNLISYFTLIWNDRDWDYHFWIDMNIKKLERMEHNIRNYSNHLYCERDADNIRKAVLALKRLREDDYHENAFRNHDKKYGELRTEFKPLNDGTGSSEMLFHRDKAVTEKDLHYERKSFRRLYKHECYLKQQDLEYATKIINKYLFHWWS